MAILRYPELGADSDFDPGEEKINFFSGGSKINIFFNYSFENIHNYKDIRRKKIFTNGGRGPG
jgi:hypothetical protein